MTKFLKEVLQIQETIEIVNLIAFMGGQLSTKLYRMIKMSPNVNKIMCNTPTFTPPPPHTHTHTQKGVRFLDPHVTPPLTTQPHKYLSPSWLAVPLLSHSNTNTNTKERSEKSPTIYFNGSFLMLWTQLNSGCDIMRPDSSKKCYKYKRQMRKWL